MKPITILQIITSLVLICSIILQSRGSQLGMSMGGGGESYRSKRGFESFLFYVTIVFSVIFAALSILSLLPGIPGLTK